MKISIITVCLNSEKTLIYTLNSVINQTYNNVEHVIVDGGSKDETLNIIKNYRHKNKKIIYAKGKSLYESLNIGIKKSSGQLISILHSDDIFNSPNILSKVAKISKKTKKKIFFGSVVYFKNKNFDKIIRDYSIKNFSKKNLYFGNMPPHTGSFYKKEIFLKYGYYNKNFKIAGDFEHIFRLIFQKNLKYIKLNFIVTRMKTGGLSSKNLNSFLTINKEIIKSFKIYNQDVSLFRILLRIFPKITQYIFLNQKKLNKNFDFSENILYKNKLFLSLNIIQNIKKLDFNRNFILSALNLAFLGSLSRDEIKIDKDLINWPDGIFSTIYQKKLNKVPGRKIISDLKINKIIKQIVVLGNLSKNSEQYLKNRFKLKIIHKNLPFGKVTRIIKSINFKFKKSDLIFITLPTPKQEQIAQYLKSKNKYFKIICIGGSIGIISGDEKPVPNFLFYLEFIWRLRYETLRRLSRLFRTFYLYILDILITGKLRNIKIKILN